MNKERLQDIKKKYNYERLGEFIDAKPVNPYELKWLIQQAERVQELEGTVKHAMKAIDNTEAVRAKLINAEQQNKRYREAIEVAIHNMATSDNLGVKFALGILEQTLEGENERNKI